MRPHHGKLSFIQRAIDAAIVVSLFVFCTIGYRVEWIEEYAYLVLVAVVLQIFVFNHYDIYRSWRISSVRDELALLVKAWLVVVGSLMLMAFISKLSGQYSRRVVITWVLLAPSLMIIVRVGIRYLLKNIRRHGYNTRTVAIVGVNKHAAYLEKTIRDATWMGLRFVGYYDDRTVSRRLQVGDVRVNGSLDDLIEDARRGKIDTVYIAMPLRAETRTRDLIMRLSDTTVSVYYAPDFVEFDIMHASWTYLGDTPLVSIFENPYDGANAWGKRLFDILVSSIILTIVAVPMLAIAIGVKLTSPGPMLFKQRRYGFNGEEIEVWKFRSMSVTEDGSVVKQATKADKRVTTFGAFLRRTSLDELPQFINVLQGRMSVVGPRPHAVAHNEEYRLLIHRYMMRHKVKPGITGWAQINGWRGETETIDKMKRRIDFDLEYIRNWSLMLDVKIFILTIVRGFTDSKAY